MSCEDTALYYWDTPKFKIVLKGTFESNGARTEQSGMTMDDSRDDESAHTPPAPTRIMLDIAEIRLRRSGEKDMVSNYRKVINQPLDDTGLFSDEGITIQTDEPVPGKRYTHAFIYIRKMAFNNAEKKNVSTGGAWENHDFIFNEENDVVGFDFNQHSYNTAYDRHRLEAEYTNRVFPVRVPIPGGFVFDPDKGTNVLEIRLVIQNMIRGFEYDYVYDGNYYVAHFWGISDWLRDVKADEPFYGGNLLGVARGYVKDEVGIIDVSGAPANRLVVIIPSGEATTSYAKEANADRSAASLSEYDLPLNPLSHIDLILDYCMNFEDWRYDYFVTNGNPSWDQTAFQTAWATYETASGNYLVPPMVVDTDETTSVLNVQPGTYDVYSVNKPTYGNLINNVTVFTPVGTGTVIISPGETSAPVD